MPISDLLNISRYSLGVYQKAMEVTSHNISNANTESYSRQQVVFGTRTTNLSAKGEYGTGVKIEDVVRVKNNLTEAQIRTYNQKYGDANKRSEVLQQVESVFQEPTELGLSNLLTNYFNSFDKLASSPTSPSLRSNVVDSAESLAVQIQNIYDGLINAKIDIQAETKSVVTEVNKYLNDIRTVSQQISEAKLNGLSANDLFDQRDQAINELSKLTNVTVSNNSDDMVSVSIGGVFAADQFYCAEFVTDIQDGKLVIKTNDGLNKLSLNGGELYALTDIYNNNIAGYLDKVDNIAQQVMTSVNGLHSTGYTNHTPPQTGVNFFSSYSAGELKINTQLLDDPNYVAISGNGESGNTEIALQLADLADAKLMGNQTINDYYNAFVTQVGSTKSISDDATRANELVLNQLEVQKASYSGVSIDEEMTNVIKFQRSYEACASLVKVADEMLQTILNMVG